MNNSPYIVTNRQKRAIEALIDNAFSVKALRERIGALNPCQVISDLRKQGFEIRTRYLAITDRDGKVCHPGEYYIPDAYKCIARLALAKYTPKPTVRVSRVAPSEQPHNTERGHEDARLF